MVDQEVSPEQTCLQGKFPMYCEARPLLREGYTSTVAVIPEWVTPSSTSKKVNYPNLHLGSGHMSETPATTSIGPSSIHTAGDPKPKHRKN